MRLHIPNHTSQRKHGFILWVSERHGNLNLPIALVSFTAFVASSLHTASTFYQG